MTFRLSLESAYTYAYAVQKLQISRYTVPECTLKNKDIKMRNALIALAPFFYHAVKLWDCNFYPAPEQLRSLLNPTIDQEVDRYYL